MKKLILCIVIAVSLLISNPVSAGQTTKLVWAKRIGDGRGATPISLAITKNNGYITGLQGLTVTSKINFLDNNNILWSDSLRQPTLGIGFYSMVDMNGREGFVVAAFDTLIQYGYQRNILGKIKVPCSNADGLQIFKDENHYFVVEAISYDTSRIFIYNNDFSLIRTISVKGAIRKMSALNNYLYYSSLSNVPGNMSNKSCDFRKYDYYGNLIWEKHGPDQVNSFVCVSTDGYIYYGAKEVTWNAPGMFWSLLKVDTAGNQISKIQWLGDMPTATFLGLYMQDIVPSPNGGCVISGSVTRIQDPASPTFDVNLYDAFAIGFDSSGNISFKIRESPKLYGRFMCVGWDKNNYLITFGDIIEAIGVGSHMVWKYYIDGITTAVREESPVTPNNYSLSQNYPNPFNPATTINFSVPVSGFVSLKVYDLLGREVATLVNEELSNGNYHAKWDASGMSSGVYIYTLQTETFVSSKKMILAK